MANFWATAILAALLTVNVAKSACPTDYVELGSSCFHFGDTPDYFEGARNYCINGMGTSLAVLDDCETYSALANYLTEQGPQGDYWVWGKYGGEWFWYGETGGPVQMGRPLWAYTGSIQYPLNNADGYCMALSADYFYQVVDDNCSFGKLPLCQTDPIA